MAAEETGPLPRGLLDRLGSQPDAGGSRTDASLLGSQAGASHTDASLLAADLAVRLGDEHTLLATDSLQQFSRAFRFHFRGSNGYVWLQGALNRETPDEDLG